LNILYLDLFAVVTTSLSCTVSEIFNVEQWYALEICVKSHSRSYTTSYSVSLLFVVSTAQACIIFE